MNSAGAVVEGAQVRSADGLIGTVERIERAGPQEGGGISALFVRSQDGQRLYRVPAELVGSVEGAGGLVVVTLNAGPQALEGYRVEGPEPVAGSAGITGSAGAAATGAGASTQATAGAGPSTLSEADGTLRIPLAAEELVFEKQSTTLGKVHVHKGVRTEEESFSIPVDFEEAIVEHLSPEEYDGRTPIDPNEIIIPIVEERVVVEKRPVVVEYIRVRKNIVTKQHDVKESVRKVFVEVTQEPQDGVDVGAIPLFREVAPGPTGP